MAGWDVELLERSPAPRPDGYMMDFFGPGVEASERIGLYPRLAALAYHVEAAEYVDIRGRTTCRIDYSQFSRLTGGKVLTLLRPDIELASRLALEDVPHGKVRISYGTRVTRAWSDHLAAHVAVDNPGQDVMTADVLVGADGIHSVVRASIFGPESSYLRPLGMRAAAFIVSDPQLNAQFRNRFVLTDTTHRMVGLYSLRNDHVAAFLVYRDALGTPGAAQAEPALDRLRHQFAGISDAVDRLLELCPEHPYDDVVAQTIMPEWHRTRVILLGDASGAVSLLAGQGGSLAIAGAAQLGEFLGPESSPGDIEPALARFEQQWKPVIETAQKSGRRAAASFLPKNQASLLLRRSIIRSSRLPGIDRLIAHQILRSIAK
jgi:2-polyprenyl-6-methoxyphenol hydroxylase-like FAD-dependent oxidoreductase